MKRKILIVDDEDDILHFLELVLKEKGYDVVTAAGGEAALEVVQRFAPDVILLDLWMPEFDGAAFAAAYRAGNYERNRGRLRDWLFGIARNHLRVARRGKRRGVAELTDQPAIDDDAAERAFDEEWQREVLAQCLEEIRGEVGTQTFEAFDLFAIRGVPARAVADRLGMSENAVFLAKRRILLRLREILPVMERVW